jgi:hypothetical protein
MWALISNSDNETVLAAMSPETPQEELSRLIDDGFKLIPMTPENSPAYINGKYIDGKFYEQEGMKK